MLSTCTGSGLGQIRLDRGRPRRDSPSLRSRRYGPRKRSSSRILVALAASSWMTISATNVRCSSGDCDLGKWPSPIAATTRHQPNLRPAANARAPLPSAVKRSIGQVTTRSLDCRRRRARRMACRLHEPCRLSLTTNHMVWVAATACPSARLNSAARVTGQVAASGYHSDSSPPATASRPP